MGEMVGEEGEEGWTIAWKMPPLIFSPQYWGCHPFDGEKDDIEAK